MSYVGKWVFHSIGMIDEADNLVFLNAEEYLDAPMPYVDTSDADAVADELKERRLMIGGQVAVCEGGKLYMLMPLPEGVPQAEVDRAVAAGIIKLYDGMIADEPRAWEERDGELWLEVGEGMSETGWAKISGDDGFLLLMTTRYIKSK